MYFGLQTFENYFIHNVETLVHLNADQSKRFSITFFTKCTSKSSLLEVCCSYITAKLQNCIDLLLTNQIFEDKWRIYSLFLERFVTSTYTCCFMIYCLGSCAGLKTKRNSSIHFCLVFISRKARWVQLLIFLSIQFASSIAQRARSTKLPYLSKWGVFKH